MEASNRGLVRRERDTTTRWDRDADGYDLPKRKGGFGISGENLKNRTGAK